MQWDIWNYASMKLLVYISIFSTAVLPGCLSCLSAQIHRPKKWKINTEKNIRAEDPETFYAKDTNPGFSGGSIWIHYYFHRIQPWWCNKLCLENPDPSFYSLNESGLRPWVPFAILLIQKFLMRSMCIVYTRDLDPATRTFNADPHHWGIHYNIHYTWSNVAKINNLPIKKIRNYWVLYII